MEILERSFVFQNIELFIGLVGIYFIFRFYSKKKNDVAVSKNDLRTISEDYTDINEPTANEQNAPALENIDFIPFSGAKVTMKDGANEFFEMVNDRRSVRKYSKKPVDIEIIKKCILAAGTGPSGAHTEPWSYCLVKDQDTKASIRTIVEEEEEINYAQRMSRQWTTDLRPLRTNHIKEYLTEAPYLILIFKQTYGIRSLDGLKKVHYYNEFSVSISTGILLSAIQAAGLNSLITTPLNCGPALRTLLGRPINEKLMFLIPVGYSSDDCEVPNLRRKQLEEFLEIY